MGAELSLIAARCRAVLPLSDTALTSAPRSTSRRTFARSATAHISAVAPAEDLALTFAPLSRSSRIASSEPNAAACISGVAPPRRSGALISEALPAIAAIRAWSPLRIAW